MSQVLLKKGDRTRQIILDSAYGLIIQQGYAATSMRQIAENANLALGSIYNHFPSKEDVFREIVQERHPFFQILPVLISVQGDTTEEFVRNAARTLIVRGLKGGGTELSSGWTIRCKASYWERP